jgi:hypothetical protein
MTLLSDLALFEPVNDGCGSQAADGRLVLAPIANCDAPPVYSLVPAVTPSNASTVSVTITGATADTEIFLQAGRVVKFGTILKVVAATTKISGVAVNVVPIEPQTGALTAADIAEVVSALEVTSVGDMPINFSTETENDDRLSDGIQGDMSITKVRAASPLSLFVRSDDAGMWEKGFLFQSGTGIITLYALVAHAKDKLHVIGKVQFHGMEISNSAASLKKATSTMQFKPPFYAPTHFKYLETAEQTAINNVRTRFGLAPTTA